VHAIPLYAIKAGLLTVAKAGKKNIFSGRILEIEGLPDLKVEQAFELSDASAERSAAGCTIKLNPEPIKEYLTSNIVLMKNMIADGYQDARTLERRIEGRSLAGQPAAAGSRQGRRVRRRHRDRPGRHQGAHPVLPQRPGRRQDPVRSGRHQDRRGLHRLVHDQHRPLPRRGQAAGRQRDIPVKLWVAPPTKMDAEPS
jgi:aconitate hydratase 2/2-methylisocitrate dehydratase